MKKLLCVSLALALAACVNFAFADEKGSPVEKVLEKLFSASSQESKKAEKDLLKDESPETLIKVRKEIELGCKEHDYEKVQRLSRIENKMLDKTSVRGKELVPGKKQVKQFAEQAPGAGGPKPPALAGNKLPKDKDEKGGQK